jgi:hypothetical protein
MSPAPTSVLHDGAISNTTSSQLTRPIRRLDAPLLSSFRTSLMSVRDERRAGISPRTHCVRLAG